MPPVPTTPAAGICPPDDSSVVTIALEPDVPSPRCVALSGQQRIRVVNHGDATHVALGTWQVDLDAGGTATSPQPIDAYVASGVRTLAVARYTGSGPELQVR
jgi:hypothetical protein